MKALSVKKLSPPSSIILLRADNNKPKIIDCEKIENIDSADDENFSPDLKQEILPAVQTKKEPLATPLIYLPQIEQPQFFHREYLKMHFKKYRGYEKLQGVISEWNQLDNAFENAKKNNCLAEKKGQILRQLKDFVNFYPLKESYIFAGDIYSAYKEWALAYSAYSNGGLSLEAAACAVNVVDKKIFVTEFLNKQLLKKNTRTLDDWRIFFYCVAEIKFSEIAAEVIEKTANNLTAEEKAVVCQGGYKILVAAGKETVLNWNNFNYSSNEIQQIILALKKNVQSELPPELPKTEIKPEKNPVPSNMRTGTLTAYNQSKLYGFIDENIFFHLRQVEDENLKIALNESGVWRKNIKVQYVLGQHENGTAADHIALLENETLPQKNSEIHNGILESYNLYDDYGKVSDNESGNFYGFKSDAVLDPCLKIYLRESFEVYNINVEFTLKLLKSKEIVSNLRLTAKERQNLNKKYGLSESDTEPPLTADVPTNLPEYQSLPPLKENFVPAPPRKKLPIKIIPPRNYFEQNKNEEFERGCIYWAKKNYPQAVACFEESIHDENYFEKSLKNLMSIYKVDYGENLDAQIEKGLQLLKQYENRLDKNTVINERIQLLDKAKRRDELIAELQKAIDNSLKINQKLHYLFKLAREYGIKGDYSAAIENYEKWIAEKNSNRFLSQQIKLQEILVKQNIAVCLYLSGEKVRAKEIAQKILPYSNNQTLQDILNDELRTVNFDSEEFSGGLFQDDSSLSPYAQYIFSIIPLEKTYSTTYHRLFKSRFDKKFVGDDFIGTPEQAARIRDDIINSLTVASDKERSEAWAFVAKLISKAYEKNSDDIDSCEKNKINSFWENISLAQFMGYAGDFELKQSIDCKVDTARFFYNEEMNIVPINSDIDTRAYFIKLIASFFLAPNEVIKLKPSQNNKDKNAHLNYLGNFEKCFSPERLLVSTFFFPDKMQKRISEFLEAMAKYPQWREELKKLSLKILSEEIPNLTEKTFITYWKKLKEVYKNNNDRFSNFLADTVRNYDNINGTVEKINELRESVILSETDSERLQKYCDTLLTMSKIAAKSTFEEKEEDYKKAIEDSDTFIEDVRKKPTKLSYEILNENFSFIYQKAEEELKKLYESSVPELTIETNIIGAAPIQFTVTIENKENCQTAANMNLEVKGISNNIEIRMLGKTSGATRGGARSEFLYEALLKEKEKYQGYFEISVCVNYRYRIAKDETKEASIERNFNLSLLKNYEEINNVYSQIAESNGVPMGSNLFYGRDEDIKKIVQMLQLQDGSLLKNRGVIMYGQKRAGKTSIMNHLKQKIRDTYGQDAYIIVPTGSVGQTPTFFSFLATIIYKLKGCIQSDFPDLYKYLEINEVAFPVDEIESDKNSDDAKLGTFKRTLGNVIKKSREFGKSENKYIPLFLIDEFTYFYQRIKTGEISSNFMQFWKGFLQDNPICAIIIGMDHMPQFIEEYTNEFACMKPFEVSFLKENDTRDLANKPILLKDGSSRYKGKAGKDALSYIYKLTVGSAYLTVIFCNAFVDYLNERKTTYITRTVIENFIQDKLLGSFPVMNASMFDPQLVDPGKFSPQEQDDTKSDNKTILTYIALHADSRRELSRDKINCIDELSEQTQERQDEIINRLEKRGVLIKRMNYYKIQIDLLRMWLRREIGEDF